MHIFIITILTWLLLTFGNAFAQTILKSAWAFQSPKIDGVVEPKEWPKVKKNLLNLHSYLIKAQNDASYLYLLIDVVKDTRNDKPMKGSPWGDFFSITFDVNRNRRITPKVDVSYRLFPGTYKLGISYYLGPASLTKIFKTRAKLGVGFRPSTYSNVSHRIWEVAIPLKEIQAHPGQTVRFGIETYSRNPKFWYKEPKNFNRDFSRLFTIALDPGVIKLEEKGKLKIYQEQREPTIIRRSILPDGTVELRYSDGTIKHFRDGRVEIIWPDRTIQSKHYIQAQPATPPELPGDNRIIEWLEWYNDRLLDIIKKLVNNNENAITYYLRREGEYSQNLYEQLFFRMNYISKLTEIELPPRR